MIRKYNYDKDDWDYICKTEYEYAYVYAVINKENSVDISIYRTNELNLEGHVSKHEERILKFKLYNLQEYLKKGPEYCFKYFDVELNKMAIDISFLGY